MKIFIVMSGLVLIAMVVLWSAAELLIEMARYS